MWKCLLCKFYMDLNTEKCTKCKQRQKDNLTVDVKKEELYEDENGHLVSLKDASEQEQQLAQYWKCPDHGKIMRVDQVCPCSLWRIDQYAAHYGIDQK